MKNVYYTAQIGKRNGNGNRRTKGEIYIVRRKGSKNMCTPHGEDGLECIADYNHQSGGAPVEQTILAKLKAAGIKTEEENRSWREFVNLIEI